MPFSDLFFCNGCFLKARYWSLIITILILLVIAILIDQNELQIRKIVWVDGTSAFVNESVIYQSCTEIQEKNVGPLIPSQDFTGSASNSNSFNPDKKVPAKYWSTQAGFSISTSTDPEYWAQMLGSGWFIDWNILTVPLVNSLDHWQMIRVHEDCITPSIEEIQSAAKRFSGQVWIIGNEPDVIWQDNVTAARYAHIYHDLYTIIKFIDPTAQIAVGGVSQATPLRMKYLDQVVTIYLNVFDEPMPVDWWTVHGYILREEKNSWGVDIPPGIDATQGELREVEDHGRLDLFENQIRSFREWMADHGYKDTPLALTEFGILMPSSYGFPIDFVANYLEQTFTWLYQAQDELIGYPEDRYHLVQKWAWFSISDPIYPSSNLGNLSNGNLTVVGESFRNIVTSNVP